jgi:hypothetical protein
VVFFFPAFFAASRELLPVFPFFDFASFLAIANAPCSKFYYSNHP